MSLPQRDDAVPGELRRLARLGGLRPSARAASTPGPSCIDSGPTRAGYLETQHWIERSMERCQCAATMRFLSQVKAGIVARIAEIDSNGKAAD